jgi:hypothetical protein
MHKNIETAKVLAYLVNTIPARCGISQVACQEANRCAMRLDRCEKTLWRGSGLSGNDGDVSALLREGNGSGSPDTAGTPSH